MKKIFKKFLVSLSVCCLAIVCSLFVLAGCSNEDGENTTKVIPPDIAFTVAEKNLTIGDEEYLFPVYQKTQGYTLSYQSSNPAIVQVNNEGKLTAIAEGNATISAIYSNGSAEAKADILVKSSFSGYLPELKTMGVDETLAITLNETYAISPYVFFNGKNFDDVTVSYSILNDSVATVNANGEVVAKAKGQTQIIMQGNWRGKDKTAAPTMQKTVTLSVVDDIIFYNNGEALSDQSIYTLAEFDGKTYENTIPCDFKVSVNGVVQDATFTIADETILNHQGSVLRANGFGTTEVRVEKEVDSTIYSNTFTVNVVRVEKTVEDVVPLFSTIEGTYLDFAKNQTKSLFAFIGEENAMVDAYQGNRQLRINENQVLGVESSLDTARGTAEISVGTDKIVYHFTLETLAKAISSKQDLYVFKQVTGQTIKGYFELLCDIEATGVNLNEKVTNTDDPVTCFSGVFNGAGHTISNLCISENASMFGSFGASAVVKNLALTNLFATRAYFLAEQTYNDGVTITDLYISLNPATETPRGLTGRTGSASVCKNVVIEYLGANAEKNREYSGLAYSWQGLIGGMWRRVVDGVIYAHDTKWQDVYVISPFVVSFRANEKNDLTSEQNTSAYGYGANETKDIYGKDIQSQNTRPNPNAEWTWLKETYISAKYTNLYHYTSYDALTAAYLERDYSSFNSEYWVVYNGCIMWKSMLEEKMDIKVFDGDTQFNTQNALASVGKELKVKAYVDGQEIANSYISVSVEPNAYITWNARNKSLQVNALPMEAGARETIKVTVTIRVGECTFEKTFTLTVRSTVMSPIHSGGNFNSGDNYEGYYGGVKDPIHSGGNFDGGDNYGD